MTILKIIFYIIVGIPLAIIWSIHEYIYPSWESKIEPPLRNIE